MRRRNVQCVQESGNVVGEVFGCIWTADGFGFSSSAQVERDAIEVLRVFRDLKAVTGAVRGKKGNQNERFAGPLPVIVHRDAVCFDLGHDAPPEWGEFLNWA